VTQSRLATDQIAAGYELRILKATWIDLLYHVYSLEESWPILRTTDLDKNLFTITAEGVAG
jgi:hypothetical protein